MKITYNPKLKERASKLRKNATFSERALWQHLRSRKMLGYQFMRQKPVGNYIVDFYCSKLGLIVEVDGITHTNKQRYDQKRDEYLEKLGLTILHINAYSVLNNISGILELISGKIRELEKKTTP